MDKTLCNDFLCFITLNQQRIQWTQTQRNPQEHIRSLETPKKVRISLSTKHCNKKYAGRSVVSV